MCPLYPRVALLLCDFVIKNGCLKREELLKGQHFASQEGEPWSLMDELHLSLNRFP
jgi:hypothetical protein